MQNPPRVPRSAHYTPLRRLLFPYSGEEALSFKQSLRVLFGWMVLMPLVMSLCSLLLTTLLAYSLQKIGSFFVFTLLSGFFIFGGLGILVIIVNNQSARIRQGRNGPQHTTQGGRYGSKR